MGTLSTQLRCDRCGAKVPDGPNHGCCPGCGIGLSEAGTWSEVAEWGNLRQVGRGRFILRTVLRWGLLSAAQCAAYAYRGETDPWVYAMTALWLVGGYVFGTWYWRSAEEEYTRWQSGRPAP
jgi:hypothetical protein